MQLSNDSTVNNTSLFDRASIYISAACAIHCLVTPVILALTPAVSIFGFDEHTVHVALIGIIVPLSLSALYVGCKKHRDRKVIGGVIAGLLLLVLGATVAHDVFGEIGEKVLTVVASLMLIGSHWRNFRLCRKSDCKDC